MSIKIKEEPSTSSAIEPSSNQLSQALNLLEISYMKIEEIEKSNEELRKEAKNIQMEKEKEIQVSLSENIKLKAANNELKIMIAQNKVDRKKWQDEKVKMNKAVDRIKVISDEIRDKDNKIKENDNQMKEMSAKWKTLQEERQRMIEWIKQRNEEVSALQLDKRILTNSHDDLKKVMRDVLNEAKRRQYGDIVEMITPNRRDQPSTYQSNTTRANYQLPTLTYRPQITRNNHQSQESARVPNAQPACDDCALPGHTSHILQALLQEKPN